MTSIKGPWSEAQYIHNQLVHCTCKIGPSWSLSSPTNHPSTRVQPSLPKPYLSNVNIFIYIYIINIILIIFLLGCMHCIALVACLVAFFFWKKGICMDIIFPWVPSWLPCGLGLVPLFTLKAKNKKIW